MMNRHISIGEFVCNLPAGLCGASTSVFLLFDKKSCDGHEIIRKHCRSHQEFKPLTTLSQATIHATPAEENGDPTFNTGTETLTILEGWTFFVGLLGLRFLPAALRDAHKLDTSFRAMFDILFAEKSSIGSSLSSLRIRIRQKQWFRYPGGKDRRYSRIWALTFRNAARRSSAEPCTNDGSSKL